MKRSRFEEGKHRMVLRKLTEEQSPLLDRNEAPHSPVFTMALLVHANAIMALAQARFEDQSAVNALIHLDDGKDPEAFNAAVRTRKLTRLVFHSAALNAVATGDALLALGMGSELVSADAVGTGLGQEDLAELAGAVSDARRSVRRGRAG